jgi:catechol-2,3-dioxygenase
MKPARKRLGELVLRSANAPALVEFYRDVIGLETYAAIGSATFLKIDEETEGHPQFLAIFEASHEYMGPRDIKSGEADARIGTLHHFAFLIEQKEFVPERDRLQNIGIELEFAEFTQFGWRSMFMRDPDGNSVELVCYDETILDRAANQRVMNSGNKDNN